MSTKAWIIFATVCAVIFGGLIVWSTRDNINVSNVNTDEIQPATENSGNIADHVYGNADSKVVLIEYGDFQCPGCAGAHPTLKAVSEKYKDELAFVFRNFPLTTIHPNARAAAAAVEAAGINGKYWEMNNLMFERQSSWSGVSANERTALFTQFAVDAGIDADTFTKTLEEQNARINRKINFDLAVGRKAGADSTPTIILNGEKLDGSDFETVEALEKKILEAFKDNNITIPENTDDSSKSE